MKIRPGVFYGLGNPNERKMERRALAGPAKKRITHRGGFCDEEWGMGRLASGNQGGDQPAPFPVIWLKSQNVKSSRGGGLCTFHVSSAGGCILLLATSQRWEKVACAAPWPLFPLVPASKTPPPSHKRPSFLWQDIPIRDVAAVIGPPPFPPLTWLA